MRRWILAAAGLALLVPAALAQTAPAPAGAAPGATPPAAAPPAVGPGPMAGGPAVPPPPPGGHGMAAPPPPPPPPPSPAAHIRLQRGDVVVDVKCQDADSTKACADTANAMFDRLAGQSARN